MTCVGRRRGGGFETKVIKYNLQWRDLTGGSPLKRGILFTFYYACGSTAYKELLFGESRHLKVQNHWAFAEKVALISQNATYFWVAWSGSNMKFLGQKLKYVDGTKGKKCGFLSFRHDWQVSMIFLSAPKLRNHLFALFVLGQKLSNLVILQDHPIGWLYSTKSSNTKIAI